MSSLADLLASGLVGGRRRRRKPTKKQLAALAKGRAVLARRRRGAGYGEGLVGGRRRRRKAPVRRRRRGMGLEADPAVQAYYEDLAMRGGAGEREFRIKGELVDADDEYGNYDKDLLDALDKVEEARIEIDLAAQKKREKQKKLYDKRIAEADRIAKAVSYGEIPINKSLAQLVKQELRNAKKKGLEGKMDLPPSMATLSRKQLEALAALAAT